MRVVVAVLAVLLIGGLGWLLRSDEDPGEGTLGVEATDPSGKHAPSLRATGSAPTAPADPGAATTPANGGALAPAVLPPAHHVMGRIAGLDAREIAETRVRIRGLGEYDWVDPRVEAAEAPPGPDGSFKVDVGAMRAKHPNLARIRVEVDHPAYVLHKSKHDLARRPASRTEVHDLITLTRAVVLQVTVHAADGKPLAEARVALYAMKGQTIAHTEEHDARVLDHGTTDPLGALLLRTDVEGPALLVGNGTAHVPTGRRVVLSSREPSAPIVLALDPGHPIEGRVLLNGEPLPGASVRAYPQIDGDEMKLQQVHATWSEGRLLADSRLEKTDAEGRFRFHGQDRSPRNLRVIAVDDYFMRNRSIGWSERLVTAPAEDLELRLEAAIVDLQIVAGSEPLKDVRIGMATPNATWRSTRSSPTGEVTVLLPVNKPMVIFAEHKQHEKAERTLAGLGPGTRVREVLDMGPAKATASLRVTLKKPDGSPVTSAGFVVEEDTDEPFFLGFEEGLGLRTSKTGVYVLDNLQPGPSIVAVFPERRPDAHHGTWLVQQERVVLVEGREASLDVATRRGASIVVSVKDGTGGRLESFATLRSAGGEELDVTWFWSTETSASMSSSGPGAAPSTMLPPLAPGEYELDVSADGYRSRKVRFQAAAGETKPLDVVLEKE